MIPETFESGLKFNIPLWDTRWPKKALQLEYRTDPRSFDRGFRQRAYSEDERTFPHWDKIKVRGLKLADILINATYFTGVDLSSDERPGTVIFTIAVLPNGRKVVVNIKCGAWSPTRVISEIGAVNDRYKPSTINVENNALQDAVVEWAVATNLSLPVKGFTTSSNKVHPEIGLPGLEVELNNNAWILLMDDPYDTDRPLIEHEGGCPCPYHRFLNEVYEHPFYPTTDIVMAWWFAREAGRVPKLMIYAA